MTGGNRRCLCIVKDPQQADRTLTVPVMSRVKVTLTPETEAVKVVVTNDAFGDDDPAYQQNADGWPRILSRLKTLLETGKTFRPH